MRRKDKTFRKQIYIEIERKKRKIHVDYYLVDHFCDEPIKRFTFRDYDTIRLTELFADLTVYNYENSSS